MPQGFPAAASEPLQTVDGEWFLVKSDVLAGTMTFSSSKETMSNVTTLSVSRVKEIPRAEPAGQEGRAVAARRRHPPDGRGADLPFGGGQHHAFRPGQTPAARRPEQEPQRTKTDSRRGPTARMARTDNRMLRHAPPNRMPCRKRDGRQPRENRSEHPQQRRNQRGRNGGNGGNNGNANPGTSGNNGGEGAATPATANSSGRRTDVRATARTGSETGKTATGKTGVRSRRTATLKTGNRDRRTGTAKTVAATTAAATTESGTAERDQ